MRRRCGADAKRSCCATLRQARLASFKCHHSRGGGAAAAGLSPPHGALGDLVQQLKNLSPLHSRKQQPSLLLQSPFLHNPLVAPLHSGPKKTPPPVCQTVSQSVNVQTKKRKNSFVRPGTVSSKAVCWMETSLDERPSREGCSFTLHFARQYQASTRHATQPVGSGKTHPAPYRMYYVVGLCMCRATGPPVRGRQVACTLVQRAFPSCQRGQTQVGESGSATLTQSLQNVVIKSENS